MNMFLAMLVKPMLLSSVQGYGAVLQPLLAQVLITKGNIPADQANALSTDLVTVATNQLTLLINKL